MNLKGILAISGQPGLFRNISQGKNHIIVESIVTGKRMPAYSTAKISSLEDIAIYTYEEDIPLKEVFQKIYDKEEGGKAIDHKASSNELFAYVGEVLPQIDKERVYASDLKKLVQWYNLLHEHNAFDQEPEAENETETENTSVPESSKEA